jgi:hypothetical protein
MPAASEKKKTGFITLSGKLVNSDLHLMPSPLRERVRVRVKS